MEEKTRKNGREKNAEKFAKHLTIENLKTEQIEIRYLEDEFLEDLEEEKIKNGE